jgi:KamA family protein
MVDTLQAPPRYQPITLSNIASTPQWARMSPGMQEAIRTVGRVLPFRTNRYLMDELIDWDRVPADPIFQLTFPQREMLEPGDYGRVRELLDADAPQEMLHREIHAIRASLNPHPAGQATDNVPQVGGEPLPGAQHKYPQTLLFFPSQGQTCHAYCTFCFRWPQFVGDDHGRFRSNDADLLMAYLASHREITDLLFTGGDPMVMRTEVFRRYVEPILRNPDLDHVQTIRIGTKSPAYWPQRFTSDADADDLLRLFEAIVESGRTLSVMGHFSHPVELEPAVAQQAIRQIRGTGANIRMQSPVIRHVNDDPQVWASLWQTGVRLGCVPYYMFVERDTGARRHFEMPLERCWQIYQAAYSQVSGLARTVRGPSMSAWPGKVHVLGVAEVGGEQAFILQYLQCRRPELVRRPFFARFDPAATWFDQLEPLTERDAEMFPQSWPGANRFVPITIDEE